MRYPDDPERVNTPIEYEEPVYDPKRDPDSDYGDWLYESFRGMQEEDE